MTRIMDKPSTMLFFQTVLGIFGFLIVIVGATTTNGLYGEIRFVESRVNEYKESVDSQEEKLNEINVITHEILVELKWQKDMIERIVNKLESMETR